MAKYVKLSDVQELCERYAVPHTFERALTALSTVDIGGIDRDSVPIERITFNSRDNKPAPTCTAIHEQDEITCHCGLRWGADEDRPPCPHGR